MYFNTDDFYKNLSKLGKEEIKKRHLAYLRGNISEGIPLHWVIEMKLRGYISQGDMNYIVH